MTVNGREDRGGVVVDYALWPVHATARCWRHALRGQLSGRGNPDHHDQGRRRVHNQVAETGR